MPIPSPADFRNKTKKNSEVREMLAQVAETLMIKSIPNVIDFNDYKTSGQYTISANIIASSSNAPPTTAGGVLEIIGSGAIYLTSQKFTSYNGEIFTRSLKDVWSPWQIVAIDSGTNITTAIDFNDLKAKGEYTVSYLTVTESTNAPPISAGGVLVVEGGRGNYLTTQRFTSWTGVVYTRSLQNSWTNWIKAIQSTDIAITSLTTAIDFNTYNTPKTYTITYDAILTSTNKPPSSVGGVLEVVGSGGIYLTHQFFRDYNGNCFYRAKQNNWGNWKKIVTSDDIVPNVSALNGKKWLAIGDSITFGLNNTSNKSYANVLAERHGATLTKHATSGAWVSAGTGVVSIPNILSQTYTSLSDAANYDLITIAAGTNDRVNITEGNLGEFTDRTTATFYGALHTLISGLKTKYQNARMLFISQIPRSGLRTNPSSPTALDLKFKAIVEVCDYYSVPVWAGHKEFGFHPDDNETFKSSYMPDGLHPSDTGQIWFANRVEQAILSCAK